MRQQIVVHALLAVMISLRLYAQGLFESSISGSPDSTGTITQSGIDIGGYVKGAVFGGKSHDDDVLIKSTHSQTSLKLTAKKQKLGKAFTELRVNAGTIDGTNTIETDLREAWVASYPGFFDIRLGKQIVAWGRADGINPTNNITPMNSMVYSSEFDDMRLGNLLARCRMNVPNGAIEGIWIPVFASDNLLINQTMIPDGIRIVDPHYPIHSLKNSGYALRIDLVFPAVDGSISYFNGYETQPGFDYHMDTSGIILIPRAYRIQAIGVDFATTLSSFGFRGEIAIETPYEDYESHEYVPNTSAQVVLGVDKTVGDLDFLFQYSGRYVKNYKNLSDPVLSNPYDPTAQMTYASQLTSIEIDRLNRLFVGNADEWSHTVTTRVGMNLLYETLHIEFAGMYNITTEEYAINPKISYDITDAFTVSAGGRYLNGPKNSLNDLVSRTLSFAFTEMRLSF